MYLWIDALCALIIAALAWSFARRLRRPLTAGDTWLQRATRVGPLVWEIGLPVLLLAGFPRLFEIHSWTHVMTYTPDLGSLVLVATGLWFATGLTRVVKLRVGTGSRHARTLQGRLQVRAAH